MRRPWLRRCAIAAGAVPAAGLALAALSPTGWFPAVLAGHWAPQLAILALPLWCAAGRRTLVGMALTATAGIALWPHLEAAHAACAPPPGPSARSAASANLYFHARDHRQAIADLAALDPDILFLVETLPGDRDLLRDDQRWPHQRWNSPRGVGGSAILSRWPMRARHLDLIDAAAVDARIETPDGPLRVIGAHTWSPRDARRVERNRRQLDEIAGLAATEPGPLLVMGDLNASPHVPGMRALAQAGLLRPHGGEVRTWPSWLGGMGIAIDHILARGMALDRARAVGLAGSDHRAIIVRFALIRR